MELKFLGGTSEIGSTSMLLRTENFAGIFDYGLTPDSPPKFPLEPPPIDHVFLTHAHLDHSGMIPWIINKYEPQLWTSSTTLALSTILLRDNIKICELEGYPTMYTKEDVRKLIDYTVEIDVGSTLNLRNAELNVFSAGHIPGSCMFNLEIYGSKNILYTGDINTIDTRLVRGTKGVKCDILIMEGTYAGRNHELRQKIEYNFQEKIKEIVDSGGKVIIPAFAVGRTQEILLVLADLDYEVWLDGLGGEVTKLILKHPNAIRNEKKLRKMFDSIHRVRTRGQRKKAMNGDIILTTSGMLDGGPVHTYLKEMNSPKNGLLLTGFQVEGSNGRLLLDKGFVKIEDTVHKINMAVQHFDFSAHSGHKELVDFVHKCDPEHVIIYHSDNRESLLEDLSDEFTIHLPEEGKSIII